jgi:hypothetical protein
MVIEKKEELLLQLGVTYLFFYFDKEQLLRAAKKYWQD